MGLPQTKREAYAADTNTRPTKPAKSILDPAFRYRPSHATNVRETFERARRELEQAGASRATADKVVQLHYAQPLPKVR